MQGPEGLRPGRSVPVTSDWSLRALEGQWRDLARADGSDGTCFSKITLAAVRRRWGGAD